MNANHREFTPNVGLFSISHLRYFAVIGAIHGLYPESKRLRRSVRFIEAACFSGGS